MSFKCKILNLANLKADFLKVCGVRFRVEVHPEITYTCFPLACIEMYPPAWFWCEFCSHIELHLNIMKLDGTHLVVIKSPKKSIRKTQSQGRFPEITRQRSR